MGAGNTEYRIGQRKGHRPKGGKSPAFFTDEALIEKDLARMRAEDKQDYQNYIAAISGPLVHYIK